MTFLILNAVLLTVMTVGIEPAAARTFLEENERFRISVPHDWAIVSGGYHVSHYRHVQMCFNNIRDENLRVKNWTENTNGGIKSTYDASAVSRQLPEGSVYVDVAKWDGPPVLMPPFAWSPKLGPKSMIASFLESRAVSWETTELEAYRIGFLKWGWSWDI